MEILVGLNTQQCEAVTASDGPVLVLAGPGSGKTRVLTHRVAWLVLQNDVAPWRILAVTFTNKAAHEMRERLKQLLGASRAAELTLGTFHAVCARILHREANAAGIAHDYVIFDGDDQATLVRQILRDLNIDKRYSPAAIHAAISRAKNDMLSPQAYQPSTYFGEIVRRVYGLYQERLRLSNALDFDDLLLETVQLFHQHPDVAERYQQRYRYVLVDEFQDTNTVQYTLLRQLTVRQRNIFCVADEDQSIYMWRGADYRNIARLRDDHPDLVTYLLEENYRSTQTILDVARSIIEHNLDRTPKQLFTQRGRGVQIVVHEAYDQEEEARFVVETIRKLTDSKTFQPGDAAVMYRTNAQSRALEESFIRAGMPYRLVGATRFYARREIKDVLALLRLVHNSADNVSLGRVLNVPPRGIGKQTQQALEDAAQTRGVPTWWAVETVALGTGGGPDLGARAQRTVASFYHTVCAWNQVSQQLQVGQLVDRILAETGYEAYLRDGSDEGDDRWNNVLELRTVAAECSDLSLGDFLAEVALVSDVDNLTGSVDAPTLLTLHSAKGLEFPVVLIVGLEEGLLPHSRALDNPDELAEERRLMYVGVTRAQDRLYLTHAFRRARYGSYEPGRRSRFLDEIPRQLTSQAGDRAPSPAPPSPTAWAPTWKATPAAQFRTGSRVAHNVFGPGMVLESRLQGDDEYVTVVFDHAGLKRVLGSYLAPLDP